MNGLRPQSSVSLSHTEFLERQSILQSTRPPANRADGGGWRTTGCTARHDCTSSYRVPYLASLAQKLHALSRTGTMTWCTFDNTALGEATMNALNLQRMSQARQGVVRTA